MFKKAIAFLLIFTLIFPMTFAANAHETSTTPKIEEILNEYFQKSLQRTNEVSPLSLGDESLGGEAVNALTNAGYEAYYVTSSDYAALEDELMTDFASLGLNPTESYVVVISGDENDEVVPFGFSGPNASEDILDGLSSSFTYTQDGITYTMRTVTVTNVDKPGYLYKNTKYTLTEIDAIATYTGSILEALAYIGIDTLAKGLPVSSAISLLREWTTDSNIVAQDTDDLMLNAATKWEKKYLQVWSSEAQKWLTAQCSSYAYSVSRASGYVYDYDTDEIVWIASEEIKTDTYSPYYNNREIRLQRAVSGFKDKVIYSDFTGKIYFYFYDASGSSIMNNGNPLFSHAEYIGNLIPDVQDP